GLPIGSFQGYVMEGVYRDQADVDSHATDLGAEPGDVKFADLNGDGIIDANDMTVIGNPFPEFTYGLKLALAYMNSSALRLLHGKCCHEIDNRAWAALNESRADNNVTIEMLDRWTPDTRDAKIPLAHFGDPIN